MTTEVRNILKVYRMATPEEAAMAVRNVIVHGQPLWENILDFD